MTNMYCFWKGGTPPSPWTKKTDWDGKYVKMSTSVSNHGSTGGATQHTHSSTLQDWSIGYAPNGSNISTGVQGSYSTRHAGHGAPTISRTLVGDNNPYYYTLELIYTNYEDWESADRRLPAGAVILSNTALSWTGVTRFTASDGKLIKLGTYGSSGGTDGSHSHILVDSEDSSVYSGYAGSTGTGFSDASGVSVGSTGSHRHKFVNTSQAAFAIPKHIKTRLYQVDTATSRTLAGSVLFFDGAPSSNWESPSSIWNESFVGSGNENPTEYNSNSHTHSVSGNLFNSGTAATHIASSAAVTIVAPHSHAFTATVASVDHQPEYVYLVPYQLKNTLYYVNTYDKTFDVDVVMKRVQEKTMTSSLRLRGLGDSIYTPDILLEKSFEQSANADITLKNVTGLDYDIDMISLARQWGHYAMSIRLNYNCQTLSMGMRIVKPYGPNDTVINTLYHSWLYQLNKIHQKIDGMVLANRVEYALDLSLDNRWGKVLDLPRMYLETDEHYRKRLQAATKILVGCGTKAACEEVLGFVIDHPGTAEIQIGKPGVIRVYWNTDEACKRAYELQDLVNGLLPKMIPAGVQYTVYHPYETYETDIVLRGPRGYNFFADMLLQKKDFECSWNARMTSILLQDQTLDMDIVTKVIRSKTYRMDMKTYRSYLKTYAPDLVIKKAQEISCQVDSLIRGLKGLSYDMDLVVKNPMGHIDYSVDLYAKKARKFNYQTIATIVLKLTLTYDIDMVIKLINDLSLAMDVVTKRVGSPGFNMSIKLS